MDEMPSSEFRRRYATLTKPTRVTVLGRTIGEWTPFAGGPFIEGDETTARGPRTLMDNTFVDRPFNSRPFTPAPKKGK